MTAERTSWHKILYIYLLLYYFKFNNRSKHKNNEVQIEQNFVFSSGPGNVAVIPKFI